MKTLRFVLVSPLLAAVLVNLLPLRLTAASAKEEVVIDFTDVRRDPDGTILKSYEYSFGDWNKHVFDLPQRGALVQSQTGKGGLGENSPLVKFIKYPVLELVFSVGNANKAKSLNFSLEDTDGTEQTWSIPIADLSRGYEHRQRLDLAKCTGEAKPGKTPGLNLKKISAWQIKGDYSEPNVEVLLVKLIAPK